MAPAPTVSPPVETKVVASSGVQILVGLLTWALVTFIPAWKSGIPSDLQPFIPVAAAWILATAAGYLAPHTPRPDLAPAAGDEVSAKLDALLTHLGILIPSGSVTAASISQAPVQAPAPASEPGPPSSPPA
jgi:hypothetical protein